MSRASSLVLSLLLLLATSSLVAQPIDSSPILPGSELLWNNLNEIALTLPNSYDSFMASLSDQVALLIAKNKSLQDSNAELAISNQSLTLKNEDLINSLTISRQAVATSESKSERLQKGLDASIESTTRAESDARVLRGWNTFWKVTTGVGIVAAVAATVWALLK